MQRPKALWFKVFLPLLALSLTACIDFLTPAPAFKDFEIFLNPTSLTINQGSSEQTTLTVTPKNGFTGTVSLSLVKQDGSPAPSGITLSPTSVNVSGSGQVTQTLTISVDSSVQAGTYNLKVKATSGNITREKDLTINVPAQNQPDFTISLNPTSLTINQGSSEQTTLTVTPKNGFTGTVSLSLVKQDGSPAPSGITLNPTSVSVSGSNPVTQTLTIKVDSTVQAGTYSLKLKATSGNITREASLSLTVNPAPDFDISLNPTELTITQGSSASTELTITPKNGFSGTVNLSLVSPPIGVSLSPSSVTVGSSSVTKTLTISTTADTPVGQQTLTLEATSGSIRKTATLTLTVNKASEFTVNTTDDTIDARPGDGICADSNDNCSLRAAVMEANALGAPVAIILEAGTYTLTRRSNLDVQGGDLDIKSDITLKGAGAGQTILDGNGADRVLSIYEGATVRVEGVTIQNGKADYGGGIYNDGTLTLASSTVSGNTANYDGGGIFNNDYAALTLTDSTVSGNTAGYDGGGIYNDYGATLAFTNSTVSGNTAGKYGGGIYNDGTLTLTNSTVSGNTADSYLYNYGGGIYNDYRATLTLTNTTLNGNTADYGGGIYNYFGTLALTNSTVSGNTADYGGGIYNDYGTTILSFSTLTLNGATGTYSAGGGIYNTSGTVKLKGVILAGNTSESGIGPECSGSLTSQGYNLIKDNADCDFTAQTTDITGKDPALGPLANNGGPTQTHLPQTGSPVLDKVPTGDCTTVDGTALTTDQRGVTRPQGTACDIGAVERE